MHLTIQNRGPADDYYRNVAWKKHCKETGESTEETKRRKHHQKGRPSLWMTWTVTSKAG